ncbi:CBP80/20-dependent translation initiation factor isoform X1 [Cygnus atratus]|uniref:CBP80/20-dependent translation initiation factor isoform X1 n=1 Tax=Cygnus atratus TaxID=8868 RepID=UPI0015D60849|nr:CBP80/20-dependent translation initiation factor isoform X1 [Cygnus atratus]XP_035415804.1 CBP80/20-dependent translation initiation factor isoform X1 [Cygnus atratus]XP_035415806.1 CBP80/20-dependent translation initiation factor isoform X1 [Cygnus atratus]XP_050572126.1 CBP80/20-dependent translation initiation factor isoform X1 [Cygnus atratus]XP_050572127.1 CBP80/20-dependent translation initiation factor isoform X1 [Cygnus atratus]XP_050572128.1 CBP80/20-dependent translation initiatio
MENSSVASASSEAGSSRSQEIEELERFIDSYVLEYQVQGLLADKTEGDGESEKTQSNISQWTADCSEQLDGSCSPSRGKGSSSHEHNQEEWDHSSGGSAGSRPGSGSRCGSGSRSGSRGRSSQFRQPTKVLLVATNGNKEGSLDMLGTDIWAANTFDSFSGATWDLQPEKLDFTQFHRKLRNTSKHPLPHIDREGIGKGKYEDGDSINLNDIEKVLPVWQGYHPLPHEAEIAHTKKLFRRRRNDRRRQQRLPGGNKSQQHADHQQGSTKHNRDHQKLYQGGQAPHSSGRTGHHGYSQNRRWHHNQKHSPNDKETHRNAKETENLKIEDSSVCTVHSPSETQRGPEAVEKQSQQYIQEPETKRRDSIHERTGERPKINLLQSSKDRLRRRLKEKTPCLSLFTDQDEVTVETTNPEKNKMDKLIEILNSMRNNSSDVDSKLTTFMEEAQNSTNSEEMLGEIVKTIYQKAVTDRSFASTAAKLCDKMALFMVEGTKFRSLLLNMLQKDFTMREELQQRDVERWLGFITFLCEVFGTMRSSTGEPFRVLVCPIYTCLRELLQSQDVKEDAVLCCSMELQSTGRLLEEQLPEMMTELLAIARDKMLCPSESMLTRSLLLEVIELHANNWNPLTPTITQYYNKTIQKLTA